MLWLRFRFGFFRDVFETFFIYLQSSFTKCKSEKFLLFALVCSVAFCSRFALPTIKNMSAVSDVADEIDNAANIFTDNAQLSTTTLKSSIALPTIKNISSAAAGGGGESI